MRTFHLLVANSLVANVTNNFLWFALTFWVYLETQSVLATALVGGGYMLLLAMSGMFFGTFVDRHRRRASMLLSSSITLAAFALAGFVYLVAPDGALGSLANPALWAFIGFILVGAIAGNLRMVALSTSVTLLVPEDRHDRANGLVGTANGVAFAITSVLSGLAVGLLGMGWCLMIAGGLTAFVLAHLATIRIDEPAPEPGEGSASVIDVRGAVRAVRLVPGLLALLVFSTFNNFLGGAFMALMDPYGLTLMTVEAWGVLLAITSLGFIVGGILVARRGLGRNPARTLLLMNLVMWTVTILFPVRSEILPLAAGFFIYMVLVPVAEASEQTIIQRVVPFAEQGRVFGFRPDARDRRRAADRLPHRPDRAVLDHPVAHGRAARRDDRDLVRDRARARHGAHLHRDRCRRAGRDDRRAPVALLPGARGAVPPCRAG
jgi:MFS transporter, DHA3 family, multidrug efflux protein